MMHWEKIGKIFDPSGYEFSCNSIGFAQSPQTLVYEKFVRIYFSTRSFDETTGLYLSNIAFVDFSKDLKTILNISKADVLPLGELGSFDEHGIFPINPFRNGNQIFAYTCGWSRRQSVSVETSIGIVYSDDNGDTFKRYGIGPILSSSLFEPVLVGDGFVKKIDDNFHMWYIFGKPWIAATLNEPPSRIYKIGQAISKDGFEWSKNEGVQIIEDFLDEQECQALPTVIEKNGIYHMVFCYRYSSDFRKNKNRGYKLGYAYSNDLKKWNRNDSFLNLPFSEDDWDAEMMCYPHLFEMDKDIYLLYNGNQFGKFGFGAAKLLSIQ